MRKDSVFFEKLVTEFDHAPMSIWATQLGLVVFVVVVSFVSFSVLGEVVRACVGWT